MARGDLDLTAGTLRVHRDSLGRVCEPPRRTRLGHAAVIRECGRRSISPPRSTRGISRHALVVAPAASPVRRGAHRAPPSDGRDLRAAHHRRAEAQRRADRRPPRRSTDRAPSPVRKAPPAARAQRRRRSPRAAGRSPPLRPSGAAEPGARRSSPPRTSRPPAAAVALAETTRIDAEERSEDADRKKHNQHDHGVHAQSMRPLVDKDKSSYRLG